MTKTEIIAAAEKNFNLLTAVCNSMAEADLFKRPGQKWSAAEHVQHLVISTNTTTLAYSLPGFLMRWVAGKPNRPSRTFAELQQKYDTKLGAGGKASGRFIPPKLDAGYGKAKLMTRWNRAADRFINALTNNRTEADLDNYLAKHPLLGRITLRELCYFTIFHTEHHLHSIQKSVEAI